MYHMKNIVSQEQPIILPKCMYHIRNPIEQCIKDESEINISDQVIKFLKVYFYLFIIKIFIIN